MTNNILNVWNELSDKIISSILTDPGGYFPVADVVAADLTLWPPKARKVWRSIVDCVDADTLPTVEALKLRLNGNTPHQYLDHLYKSWSDEDNAKIVYYADEMKKVGLVAKLRAVGRELAELNDVEGLSEAVEKADLGLSSVSSLQTDRKGDAVSTLASTWEMVEAFDGSGILTGLGWFDRLTGGLWPGFNYWIVAAYKSGKSTLMRNIALEVAQAGHPIDFFCLEGSREMFTLDCVAMLATGLMLGRGCRTDQLRLSGLFIMRAWQRNRRKAIFTKDELECLNKAKEIWAALPIRVWDSRDGIRDRSTIRHTVKKSKLDYGSQIYMLDYSQLVGEGPIYDRQSATALMVQDIAVTEQVAFCASSQKNETSVRGDSGHSSGVKGGGDADAATDFTLIPSIDDNGYKVLLKHSRHTAAGMSEYHLTNPSSGLIIDKWVAGGGAI